MSYNNVEFNLPLADYDAYIELCNRNNKSYRLNGILSHELYIQIISDPKTVFFVIENVLIPLFIDISFGLAMGYNSLRCADMAVELSNDIYVLSYPINELLYTERLQLANILLNHNTIALFFSDHLDIVSNTLTHICADNRINFTEKDLSDPRVKDENKASALSLYSFYIYSKEIESKLTTKTVKDLYEHYIKYEAEKLADSATPVVMYLGNQLLDYQIDEMWDLYTQRFEFLGINHPISMQDTKEDFKCILCSERTIISASYKMNGLNKELICFAYFTEDLSKLYWLNQVYLEEKFPIHQEMKNCVLKLFTPGIVSSGMGRSYSLPTLGIISKVGNAIGVNSVIIYENTNLSKDYIPRIVDCAIKRTARSSVFIPSQIIDEVTYKLWKFGDVK